MTTEYYKNLFFKVNLRSLYKNRLNDREASKLITSLTKSEFCFNKTTNRLMYYNGKQWINDLCDSYFREEIKEISRGLGAYALATCGVDIDPTKDEFLKWTGKWTDVNFRRKLAYDSKSSNCITSNLLDSHKYYLNCQNGVLCLKQGNIKLIPHNPQYYMSQLANVVYDPSADCKTWSKFLDDIFEGDQEKIKYVQKLLGLCLTGDNSIEKMWYFYGPTTRNGKSTLVETFRTLLGNYAESINSEAIGVRWKSDSRQANPSIAKLKGKRFVIAPEPDKLMHLNTNLIKQLTGRDSVVARMLYQNELTFKPEFKIICNTNYLPVVSDMSVFSSDRLQVVSFNRHFTENEQDHGLRERLRQPHILSGILNWAIEGLKMYYAEGLDAPECVKSDSRDYYIDSDKLQNFLDDIFDPSINNKLAISDVYRIYDRWCIANGYRTEGKQMFIKDLKTKELFISMGSVNERLSVMGNNEIIVNSIKRQTVRNVMVGYRYISNKGLNV